MFVFFLKSNYKIEQEIDELIEKRIKIIKKMSINISKIQQRHTEN